MPVTAYSEQFSHKDQFQRYDADSLQTHVCVSFTTLLAMKQDLWPSFEEMANLKHDKLVLVKDKDFTNNNFFYWD